MFKQKIVSENSVFQLSFSLYKSFGCQFFFYNDNNLNSVSMEKLKEETNKCLVCRRLVTLTLGHLEH